jgi:filamentous hemagglutinin family protein
MIKTKFWRLILTLSGLIFSTENSLAQTYQPSNRTPLPDKTLGTQVSGNGNNFNITGGLNRGQTLLHSFTDFSIPTGGAANFNNPAGIRDIITRVTGRGFSDLNGTLNSNGANFLLINPNGVVFGPNARLNVGKAFAASTANGVDLVDGQGGRYTFGTNPNGDAPLLKINPNVFFNPSQLNMGASVPGNPGIVNYGKLQTNNDSQYIGLIGGGVGLIGGKIIAPGGKVELAGLSQAGGIGFSFNQGVQFPANVERGNVVLVTKGTSPSVINVQSAGGGGSVDIFAKDITLRGTGTQIATGISAGSSSPTTTAGDIKLDATGKIELSEADIFNQVAFGGVGKAGNIEINTRNLSLTNGGALTSSTFGTGDAGNVKITASGDVFFDGTLNQGNKDTTSTTGTTGAFSTLEKGGEGKGGNVEIINTRNLSLTNGAQLQASTKGKGDAGNVKITDTDKISVDGTPNKNGFSSSVFSTVEPKAVGNGGNVEIINTRNLSLTNGGQIQASTKGTGDAGNVKITATDKISFDGIDKNGLRSGALSTVAPKVVGNGGNIEVKTGNLSVTNGGALNTSTKGKGNAGNVKITATGDISFDGEKGGLSSATFSEVGQGGVGQGGNIEINTRNLFLTNGGALVASIREKGTGNAGNVKITATGDISVDGTPNKNGLSSAVFSTIENTVEGKGGNIEINTRNLSLTNGGQIQASTKGKGDAGNVKITDTDKISVDGTPNKNGFSSFVSSKVEPNAVGNGGDVEIINTRNLSLTNGGILQANTLGKGDAGNVRIKVTDNISFDGFNKNRIRSGAFSSVGFSEEKKEGVGKGGNVEIKTRNLSLTNGGQLQASTFGEGDAGSVKIKDTDNISFDGTSGAFSAVAPKAVGKGGNVEIDTRNLSLTNGGRLLASTFGTGDAGNIFLNANTIILNKGGIGSQSASSTGGNINISTKDYLLLRNTSVISTNSGSSGKNGNGGNITISSPLIIALPGNNDISANANAGNGGRVDITSKGLFGIKFRPIGSDFTSDITVSSTFGQSGIVNISTPGVDPGKDSTTLPNVPTDASNQISQACSASNRQNKFTVAGRGGLPPNANDPLNTDVVWQDARATSSQPAASSTTTNPVKLPPPAVGWVFDGKGKVKLIAAGAEGQPTGTNVTCPNAKTRS